MLCMQEGRQGYSIETKVAVTITGERIIRLFYRGWRQVGLCLPQEIRHRATVKPPALSRSVSSGLSSSCLLSAARLRGSNGLSGVAKLGAELNSGCHR
jgi:hypothetical protein